MGKKWVGWLGSEGCSHWVPTQLCLKARNDNSYQAVIPGPVLFSILIRDLEEVRSAIS